jgi:two-component system, NarL family, response regulator DevR
MGAGMQIPIPTQPCIKVFLVCESRLLREGLLHFFRKIPDLAIAGHSDSPEDLLLPSSQALCDVLLTDSLKTVQFASRDVSCSETGTVVANLARIVLFGMNEEAEVFLEAVGAGVTGYVLKTASATDVINAVRCVARGEAVCPPRLCLALFQQAVRQNLQLKALQEFGSARKLGLTRRQKQLAGLLFENLTNKEIAARLNLSEFTVKNHVHRIMKQLEASNRYEAVELIRANGLEQNLSQ